MILRLINQLLTARQLEREGWLAIAHPMALGDVVAALPLAGIIKEQLPQLQICFIGSPYVRPLVDCCSQIDSFVDFNEVLKRPAILAELGIKIFINPFPHRELAAAAHQAGVPVRVGNLRRHKTARYCNRFVSYSRRRSGRHEILLNLENLAGVGLNPAYPLADIPRYFGLDRLPQLDGAGRQMLQPDRMNVIFHPKSNKNGREWPAAHYLAVAGMLPPERFNILVTGSRTEGDLLRQEVPDLFALPHVTDACGSCSLPQFLALIGNADGMLASGTGPLHIAAAMGKHALGIFPPRADIDPAHWAPIGVKGEYLCLEHPCRPGGDRCPDEFPGGACACTAAITPEMVLERMLGWHNPVVD